MARSFEFAGQKEVTFVSPGGQLTIRMTENTTNAMCEAARTLKARYFVAIDGWSEIMNAPVWGVFDMRTARSDDPVRGQWSIRDPVRTFPVEANDAAVMYAVALLGAAERRG